MKVYATPEQINALMGARADRYDPRVYLQFIYLDVKAKRLVATNGHVMAEVEPEIVDAGTTTDAYFIVTGKIPKSWEVVELDFDSNTVTRKGAGTDTRKPIAIVRMPADQEPRKPIDWQRVSAHGAGFVEAIKNKGPASIGIDMSLVTKILSDTKVRVDFPADGGMGAFRVRPISGDQVLLTVMPMRF